MSRIIISLLLCICSLCQQQYTYGDTLHLKCSSKASPFPVLPPNSAITVQPPSTPLSSLLLSSPSNPTICTLSPNTTLSRNTTACILPNSVANLTYICPDSISFRLRVLKSELIREGDTLRAEFVEVDGEEGGLMTLKPMSPMRYEGEGLRELFWVTQCFVAVGEFEDHVRVAVSGGKGCGVGFKRQVNWTVFYESFPKELRMNHRSVQYLEKGKPLRLKLPQQSNYFLSVVVQNEYLAQLQQLSLQIQFITPRSSSAFLIHSIYKNLIPLTAKIYHNQPAESLTLLSNTGIFVNLILLPIESGIRVSANDILFSNMNTMQYFLQLQAPYELNKQSQIEVYSGSDNHLEVCECLDKVCGKCGEKLVVREKRFEPPCKEEDGREQCVLKVVAGGAAQGIKYMLMLHSLKNVSLEVDTLYRGSLSRNALFHYIIEDSVLKAANYSQLSIEVNGAKAFLTYDDDCKHILCCEYEDTRGQLTFPNKRKDLKIFLEGSGQGHYTLLINTPSSKSSVLTDTSLIKTLMAVGQNTKYYKYQIKKKSKSIEIICNAPHSSLILLMNSQGNDFPMIGKSNAISYDCYIQLNTSSIQKNKTIYITIQRANQLQTTVIPFSIVVSINKQIVLSSNTPLEIYYPKQSYRIFVFSIETGNNLQLLKLAADELPEGESLSLQILDNEKIVQKQSIKSRVTTMNVTSEDKEKICQKRKECKGKIKITNEASVGLDIDVLLWVKSQPIRLLEGVFNSFETGSIGEATYFYIDVQASTKPIHIYAESNEVKVQAKYDTFLPTSKQATNISLWPFPLFNDQDNKIQSVYSSAITFSPQQQNKVFKGSRGLILIGIRDISPSTPTNISNRGSVTIVYCTDFILLPEGYKIAYSIFGGQTFSIFYSLQNAITGQKPPQQIYLHNTHLTGKATIQSYLMQNTKIVSSLMLSGDAAEVLIIQMPFVRNLINSKSKLSSYYLKFVVTGQGQLGRFLANIIESKSSYRQLSLGTPEDFHIKTDGYSIFEFLNLYNQGFKIKISRKQGFPAFKIKSCKQDQGPATCLHALENETPSSASDPENLLATKKSHELEINNKSKHFCNNCRYYIRLDAINQDVDGSLTVLRPGEPSMLTEGRTSTTQVQFGEHDSYKVVSGDSGHVTIMLHNGYVSVVLESDNETLVHVLGDHTANIEIDIPSANNKAYYIDITPLEQTNIVYSIVYTSKQRSIRLEDGVPLRRYSEANKISYFEYYATTSSSIVVTSDQELKIDVFCGAKHDNITATTSFQSSKIINMSVLFLPISKCNQFMISVANTKQTTFSLLVNNEETVLVRPWFPVPGKISKDRSNIYEYPIQFESTIKIILRICQSLPMRIGLTSVKSSISKDQFDQVYNVPSDQGFYSIEREVKPGVLYISVATNHSSDLDYTLYMYAFQDRFKANSITADILDNFIEIHYNNNGSTGKIFNYNLTFSPLEIHHNDAEHTVKYFIIESQSRINIKNMLRCDGFSTLDITQTQLTVNNGTDNKLWALYPSKSSNAYITIVPQVFPVLPGWSNHQSYQIVQLSNALGPIPIQRLISSLLNLIQNLTSISDAQTLNFILFIIVFAMNMVCICICCFVFACYSRRILNMRGRRIPNTEQEAAQKGSLTENTIEIMDGEEK